MKLHRFYTGKTSLRPKIEITDKLLLWQWNKVLRFQPGQTLVLFNQAGQEALAELIEISKNSAILRKIKDQNPQFTSKQIWLFWSLLKRDNNELILQKCTELGVSNFVPIISERTIKKDFNLERAEKIVVEAAEQCGRSDIPSISSPIKLAKALEDYKKKIQLLVAEQNGLEFGAWDLEFAQSTGLLIGPEGGWTERERELFKTQKLKVIKIGDFTLRAETAAIVGASKLL